jgi:hypothetical protein
MEAPKRLNNPYLITRDTSPSRENLEVFRFSPSDGCPATATCLASTQALRSRCMSSAWKLLGGSDQGGQTAPPRRLDRPGWPHLLVESSASVLWLNRVTQWFSGEPLQTPRTWCSLRQSPLMTWLPHSPGSTLVLRLNQETVHDFVPLFLPPCGPHLTPLDTRPSNQAYLSSPHLEASPATTFRACSSPAPTPVKSQPAPTILSQELVHTTLSITHHTRKRPSTGPQTTHGPQSPP